MAITSEIHTPISAEELAHTFEEQPPEIDLSTHGMEDWVTFAIFWLMCFAVFLQFFTRYVLNDSLAGTEEIATNCLVVIVFLGAAMCVRLGRHIHVDFLFRYLPASVARALATAIDAIRTLFATQPEETLRWIDVRDPGRVYFRAGG